MSKEHSRALSRLLGPEGVACLSSAPALSPQDIADLREILRGAGDADAKVDTKQALAVLARVDRTPESAAILAGLVGSSRQTTRVRVSAAAGLGVMPAEAAEPALLAVLDTRDPALRAEVIVSLGKVGGRDSLRRLADWPATAEEGERRLVDFARTLIALRSGEADPTEVPGQRWRSQTLATIEGEVVAERLGRIWGSTYGLTLNRDVAFTMACGKAALSLLLSDELKRGRWLGQVRARPLLAGIVVARESGHDHHAVRHLVMTAPTETGFAITVTRTGGEVVFTGEATPGREGFRLAMRDVGRERFSTRVEGLITDDTVDLELQTWLGAPRLKNHGRAISPQP